MFEQGTSVAWLLKKVCIYLKTVQYPRGSFLAGQGNTAQLSGFLRTSPDHTSKKGQLFRQSPGRDSLWQLCRQMDPAATSPVCCLTPPRNQHASRWTASTVAVKATEQGGSLRAWKASKSCQHAHQLRATCSSSCSRKCSLLLQYSVARHLLNAAEMWSGTLQPNRQVGSPLS